MPAFRELLARVAEYYRERGAEMREQNAALVQAFAAIDARARRAGQVPDDAPLRAARRQIEASFDGQYGGFGAAPKFPHADHARTPAAPLACKRRSSRSRTCRRCTWRR